LKIWPLVLLALGATSAEADTNPPILPTQDVAVSYNLATPGRADQTYLLEYSAAGQLARITNPNPGTVFLVNLPAGTAQLVVPMLHAIVEAPDLSAITQQISSAASARFTALGPGDYAGRPCEKYLILNAQGTATACLTPDGVALYVHGQDANGSATVTATSVTYAPQPPNDFQPPSGFSQITLPPGALAQLLQQQ
jgi:hypothetical protein